MNDRIEDLFKIYLSSKNTLKFRKQRRDDI